MQIEKDFENARQFQVSCPLSTNLAKLGFVPLVKGVSKPLICGVQHFLCIKPNGDY